jgi:hypothetical protein
VDTKICEYCADSFPRPSWNSDGTWEQRRFCTVACSRHLVQQRHYVALDTLPLPANDWQKQAACIGVSADLFDSMEVNYGMDEVTMTARTYCRMCPVLQDCALTADRYRYSGLWAGAYRGVSSRPYHRNPLIPEAPMYPLPEKQYVA